MTTPQVPLFPTESLGEAARPTSPGPMNESRADFLLVELGITLGAVLAAVALHYIAYLLWARFARASRDGPDRRFALRLLRQNTARPVLVAVLAAALHASLVAWDLPDQLGLTLGVVLRFIIIAAIAWAAVRAVAVIDDAVIARHDITAKDNLIARRAHTRARVLTRTGMVIVGVIGAALALLTIPGAGKLTASVLASAGILGLAIGLAARPTLGNLIAGLQIALTEPINLGDAVVIEGEWGWIEEITAPAVA